MKIPLIALILQGIPEQIAVVTLAFVIAKISIDWKKISLIGIILALSSYVLRLFPITFGIHTIVLIALLFIFLIKLNQINLNVALVASLISFLALIITETICIKILMSLFNITSAAIISNTVIRILISLPQVLIMFLLAYVIYNVRTSKE